MQNEELILFFILFLFMALPFFYIEEISAGATDLILNEETSKHVIQVLRMGPGEQIRLTNGKGQLFTAEIISADRKKCTVKIIETTSVPPSSKKITIAISLIKNPGRFEWFLEKATEIGVAEIIPLICERTEKQHLRADRMKNILVSAMLQSQQVWLPVLHEPVKFAEVIKQPWQQKFIAYCEGEENKELSAYRPYHSPIILIGPEGDFTQAEIAQAIQHDFIPITLGNTRLRTETAGIVAAVICII